MTEVINWQSITDTDTAIQTAMRTLRNGGVVCFPTEGNPVHAVIGQDAAAVDRLRTVDTPLEIAVPGSSALQAWIPSLSRVARRLTQRLWPGPLTLLLQCNADEGVASQLPQPLRESLFPDGVGSFRCPDHAAILEVLDQISAPLVLTPATSENFADLIITDAPGLYPVSTVVAVEGETWRIMSEGAMPEGLLRQQSACLVVFVCTGNTCRSPLAEALCKKRLADTLKCSVEELPQRGFIVYSAGLAAMMRGPAAVEAVEVARSYGADLTRHQSQLLSVDLATRADYLIAMTNSHLQSLTDYYPPTGSQLRLLDPSGDDVADPIGHPASVYEECGKQIWQHLEKLVTELSS